MFYCDLIGVYMVWMWMWISLAVFILVEELLCEAVLHVAGRRLLLDASFQQHLLVQLPLLLLLLQVLLHAQTLAIELLILLCRVPKLRDTKTAKDAFQPYVEFIRLLSHNTSKAQTC